MASEDLVARRERLERSIYRLEWWMIGWTLLVVIGLSIEDLPGLARIIASHNWKALGGLLGGLFVTIGVAGELFVDYKVKRRGIGLRAVTDEIASEELAEATQARQKIAELEQRNLDLLKALAPRMIRFGT